MQIPDEVRKCVVFVGADFGKGPTLVGTAVILAVGDADFHFNYAVTAAHVIEGIRNALGDDATVYLRVNVAGGGAQWAQSVADEWLTHPTDPIVDVAAIPFGGIERFDHLSFGTSGALTAEALQKQGIGIGEDVFLTGLFVNHSGTARNIPIVRTGAIAAMPEEPVRTQRGLMDAFLVEARSIGGLSGSPVFVNLGLTRVVDGSVRLAAQAHAPYYLLGLMHGHYNVTAMGDAAAADALREETVNMGIGIVVPATAIIEVLDQPAFKEPRDRAIAAHEATEAPA